MNAATALSLFLLAASSGGAGDRIVTLRDEFPNQYYSARIAGRTGASS